MLPFKKILFPVDFSPHVLGAARYVEAFAGRFDADLILLHVADLPRYNDLIPQSPAQKKVHLEKFLVKELEYFRVQRVMLEGEPARTIVKFARENHIDLIMLPTHGLGGFRRFLLGSTTAKILHDADCPVWTGVHLENAPSREKIEFHRLLCAVSEDPYSKVVLASAREFADEYRAQLTVIHVTHAFEAVADAKQRIQEAAGPNCEVLVEAGDIPEVVAAAASRLHVDLLIIGRSPEPGIFGRLRTHGYPIIRQSPCPVISV